MNVWARPVAESYIAHNTCFSTTDKIPAIGAPMSLGIVPDFYVSRNGDGLPQTPAKLAKIYDGNLTEICQPPKQANEQYNFILTFS